MNRLVEVQVEPGDKGARLLLFAATAMMGGTLQVTSVKMIASACP